MSGHWIKWKAKGDRGALLQLWRRFFARFIDFLLWLLLWYFLEEKFFIEAGQHSLAHFWLDQFLAVCFMVVAEPLFLTLLSTTPGKALCGLGVRHPWGQRLTLRQACRRTWQVWAGALGLGLPFYRLVCLARAYAARRQGWLPDWEKETWQGTLMPGTGGGYGRR